ncbi:hypothetical protein BJ684DRAFT_10202 [Piptocephalis cylindrospora]|uniref:NAD(P)-binding domain-containing protein n=1 Tax=Piptocephalis cylindrospora TaxID=1907219 RepID=A0A4P9Y333_9FUNG|nr:hypothetical protein BJ684DRAFT_10202 [Piptocephalis cylindrospora]|eukprot:RKP13336.1 hypothetical protein BJ684DRAFT_10202 [Piptocephalis cylindrospora]
MTKSSRTVFITSADSHLGHKVAERMLTGEMREYYSKVVAGCVIPDKSKDLTQLGAKVVSYDIGSLESLADAMKGADLLLIIPPGDTRMGSLTTRMMDAGKAAKIPAMVLVSNIAVGSQQATVGKWISMYQDMEKHLKAQDVKEYSILRIAPLQEDLLLYARSIQDTGTLRLPMGDGRVSPIRMIDVADFISRALSGQGPAHEDFPPDRELNGGDEEKGDGRSETMDGKSMSKALSEATGKQVDFKDLSHQDATDLLRKNPMLDQSEWGLMMEVWDLVRARQLADTTPIYQDVMDRPQLSIHGFFRENASNFAPTNM